LVIQDSHVYVLLRGSMTKDEILRVLDTASQILKTATRDIRKGVSAQAALESVDVAHQLVIKAKNELDLEIAQAGDADDQAPEAATRHLRSFLGDRRMA